jgi:protein gp37
MPGMLHYSAIPGGLDSRHPGEWAAPTADQTPARARMGKTTAISWTDSTQNFWIGCTNVSPGCENCYAEALAERYGWARWGNNPRKRTGHANWQKPRQWNADAARFHRVNGRRRRVFCSSLSDVFDNQVPPEWRTEMFKVIRECDQLDWQLLTKRPQNIRKMLPPDWGDGYPNVWLGATTESEQYYRQRWPILARISAVIHFVSYEPAVGPLGPLDLGDGRVPNWVIIGGESGPRARATSPQWARDAVAECLRVGAAPFHKQWGSYRSNPVVTEEGRSTRDAEACDPPSNGKGGALLDGRLWREFPVPPVTCVP